MKMNEKIVISCFALASLAVLFLFGGVSDQDIKKCQATTNYSAERCMHEIMR